MRILNPLPPLRHAVRQARSASQYAEPNLRSFERLPRGAADEERCSHRAASLEEIGTGVCRRCCYFGAVTDAEGTASRGWIALGSPPSPVNKLMSGLELGE